MKLFTLVIGVTLPASSFLPISYALIPEHEHRLSSSSRRNQIWEQNFQQLSDFFFHHGHSKVPFPFPTNPSLSQWVRNQKTAYRRLLSSDSSFSQRTKKTQSESGLTPSRLAALHSFDLFSSYTRIPSPSTSYSLESYDAIADVMISSHRELYWKQMLDRLILFKETFGHVNVPLRYNDDPSLGQWVVNQRILWKKYMVGRSKTISKHDDLTQAKMAALDSLGFCYDVPTFQWYSMLERLVRYKEQRRKQYLDEATLVIRNQILKEYQREENKRLKNTRSIQKQLLGYQQQLLLLRYQQGLLNKGEDDPRVIQSKDQTISRTIQTLQQQMEQAKISLPLPVISDEEIQRHIEENFK